MVIRFSLRRAAAVKGGQPGEEIRLETHPSGLNRTGARRLSKREIVHRERMLEHLQRIGRSQ